MLRALGWSIKVTLFAIGILLAGSWIQWQGRTLAQHVGAHAEQLLQIDYIGYTKKLTRMITSDARGGFEKKFTQKDKSRAAINATQDTFSDHVESQAAAPRVRAVVHTEEPIPASERQKLRALIRELNSSDD